MVYGRWLDILRDNNAAIYLEVSMNEKRKLRVIMHEVDVASLQDSLMQLGYSINPTEFKKARFGKTTRQAVQDFQRRHNLEPNGIVNKNTADLLVEELQLTKSTREDTEQMIEVLRRGKNEDKIK